MKTRRAQTADGLALDARVALTGGCMQLTMHADGTWRVDWHRSYSGVMSDMRTVDGLHSLHDALCAVIEWERQADEGKAAS